MKKSILFIIPSLGAGGGEKSLINLLSQLNYNEYSVDLFLLNHEGLFMNLLPKEVNILDLSEEIRVFQQSLWKSMGTFLLKGKITLAYSRLMFCIENRRYLVGRGEQYSWKYLKNAVGSLEKKYDVAIGYLEKTSNYICVDCIQANKKIGWIHNDYRKLDLDKEFDNRYFKKLEFLVTVSSQCELVLKEEFPEKKEKVRLIHNIVSKRIIEKLALESFDKSEMNENNFNILSIGRLHKQKGFDMAIEACQILVNKGYKICWHIIGEGEEREVFESLIKKYNLQNNFKLLGLKKNPYKYINACDIYVQPSRYEGKSIAMDEAKILHKPIVSTNFSTVYDQLTNRFDGIITEMNSSELAKGIIELIENEDLKQSIISNLKQMNLETEAEINKLYELIN